VLPYTFNKQFDIKKSPKLRAWGFFYALPQKGFGYLYLRRNLVLALASISPFWMRSPLATMRAAPMAVMVPGRRPCFPDLMKFRV